jgi:hypothetical protein
MSLSSKRCIASEPEAELPTVKAALMIYTYLFINKEPLMTIGDALASFQD